MLQSMIAEGHLFEFGIMVYFIGLMADSDLPAGRFVGAASTLRMLMEKVTTKLTWMLPVLIFWLIVPS